MKKRLIALVVLVLLLGVVPSAIALPLNCEYCGSSRAPEVVSTYPTEYYNTPCTHGMCGCDTTNVWYEIVKSYCPSCGLPREESWTELFRTFDCHGWRP